MGLAQHEVPVAFSLVSLIKQGTGQFTHPIGQFTCYWAAFNNIYVTIADRAGHRPRLTKRRDGSIRRRVDGSVSIPEVSPVSERQQIDSAFQRFSDDLKQRLIEHPSTRFFVYRTPYWKGRPIATDSNGQQLNGVLNVGYTLSVKNPVWAPIDTATFELYSRADVAGRDLLSKQILNLLYTIRNNAFHGGKRADDAHDSEVLENGFPLLAMIVDSLVEW